MDFEEKKFEHDIAVKRREESQIELGKQMKQAEEDCVIRVKFCSTIAKLVNKNKGYANQLDSLGYRQT